MDFQLTSDSNGKWNREHTFPRSRAGYYSIEEDEIADGKHEHPKFPAPHSFTFA